MAVVTPAINARFIKFPMPKYLRSKNKKTELVITRPLLVFLNMEVRVT